MKTDIKGKKAIVTGGGSGYGKGIAAALAGAGAKVWITGRNAAKIEAAAQEIGARPFVADVSVPGDWDRLFAVVEKRLRAEVRRVKTDEYPAVFA